MIAYDIREIRLIKSHTQMTIPQLLDQAEVEMDEHPEVKLENWFCLGHFDLLQIRAVDSKMGDPLACIKENMKRVLDEGQQVTIDLGNEAIPSSNFIDSLYALKPRENTSSLELFPQKENRRWLLLVRLHCDRPEGEEQSDEEPFTRLLLDACEQFCNNNKYEDFFLSEEYFSYSWVQSKHQELKKVLGCFYETLELGDIFGFLKCDVLSPLLELAQYLYGRKCVSAVYSYVGVNCSKIPRDGFTMEEKKTLSNRTLSYLSTRFSVRQVIEAQNFLKDREYAPKGHTHYVAGTADLMIQWDEKNEYALLCWLRNLIKRMREKPDSFYTAFYDTITRVGVGYEMQKNCREMDLPASRLAAFDRVVDYAWLYQKDIKLPSEWGPTLMRLLVTLRTMSANSAMDDLAAMLIPGVRAFLCRLKMLNNLDHWDEHWNGTITYFLERWIRLTDDMLHLESQLTQHPELNPTPHAIPAMLLQLEQRFVRQAAELLEDDVEGSFVPVVFPCLTDHIRTRSVLNPHDNSGKVICPLSIEAPVEQLFSPFVIEHVLAHEVAHYCGAALRLREERLDCLCHCYAYVIVHYWDARIRENRFFPILPDSPKFSDEDYNILAERIKLNYRRMLKTGEAESLKEIRRYLHVAAIQILGKHEWYEEYEKRMIANLPLHHQLEYAKMNYWLLDYSYYSRFAYELTKHGDLLYHLCKECYADIAMICLLDCKPLDYYNAVFGLEMARLEELKLNPQPYAVMRRHWTRLRLVSNAIGKKDWLEMNKEKEEELKSAHYSLSSTEPTPTYAISTNEYNQLLEYLKKSKRKIEDHLSHKPQVEDLRNIYRATRPESFTWNVLRRYAEQAAREWRTDKLA